MKKNLSARDKDVIWHPYTPQKYAPEPIPVAKGEGLYIIDTNGKKYMDCISSWWVTIHGHGHPYIAKKIYEQALVLEQVIFAGFTHEPAVRLAERLLPILPGQFARVFYSDNGSTAVEVALKMALQYWWNRGNGNRTKVLAFSNAYHGDTFGAMSVSARSVFTAAFDRFMFDVVYLAVPDAENFEENKAIIDEVVNDAACFIYEPLLQGAGGMVMYQAADMDNLLSYVKMKQIITIADEVLTGFGRTGELFAGNHLSNKADIICLSKGLTGGTMALGVTACTAGIYEAFLTDDRFKTFFHGHSFTANPIACAAALASLDLLLASECQDSIRNITRMQASFAATLRGLTTVVNVTAIRQLGTIIAFDITANKNHYLNTTGAVLAESAREAGIFLRPLGNTIYLMPPYCITAAELEFVHITLLGLLQKNFV
ncbi:MAG: adenosylmethionine--8-amino-7-oxononanoate transaminase [Chitinophagaceae bacterium]|nr:MAG: adenosylmethionine--8-amino-7-oxononanoate transaminase [Chitinophagaceae bacterium]